MTFEFNSHHVVDLALVPVSRRPDVGDGVDRSDLFRNPKLEPQIDCQGHGIEFVNNFETRLASGIVDARDVDQVIEREIVAAKLCHFVQIGWEDGVSGLAAKLRFLLQFWPEQFAERIEEFRSSHMRAVILSGAKNLSFEAENTHWFADVPSDFARSLAPLGMTRMRSTFTKQIGAF